jgi:uncharacterized protein YjbJ (UPF0337 family)
MNWDQIEGKWKQLRGSAKQQWGKLTDSDIDQIAGKRDALVGKLQERYGMMREEAQSKAEEWLRAQKETGLPDRASSQTARQETHQTAKG